MNRKSNNKQFFSEELLQEIFSNLHSGQYNCFHTLRQKKKTRTERRRIVVVSELHF